MVVATDYDKIYRNETHALGAPSAKLVTFFGQHVRAPSRVLDLGCGQGRDALFIARLGHRVVAIDSSPAGIRQLADDAKKQLLDINASVEELSAYQADDMFDVVLLDRVLHMLDEPERLDVLKRNLAVVREGGFVLILDEASNIGAMKNCLARSELVWSTLLSEKGHLFVQRQPRDTPGS